MKLRSIIGSLDKKTLNSLSKFILSPYHNERPEATLFIQALIDTAISHRTLGKHELWSSTFENKAYNDAAFRKLSNYCLNLVEFFFSLENFKTNDYIRLNCLTKFCEFNRINELQNKLTKSVNKTIKEGGMFQPNSLYNLYTSKSSLVDFESIFEKKKAIREEGEILEDLSILNELLDSTYELEKIRLLLLKNAFSVQRGLTLKTIPNLKKPINTTKVYVNSQLLKNYINIYDLLLNDNEELELQEMLAFLDQLVTDNFKEAFSLYDLLNNYLVRKINRGQNFYSQWFQLLKFGLKSKLIFQFDKIDPAYYRNIVVAACRLNQFDWALKFVENYKGVLAPKYRISAHSFNKARVFMNMQRYEDVIDVLRNVEYEDITYNINSRLMLIASFYELDEYDILESTIKAFKVFLRRKRNISVSRKANFTDHCDVIYNLIKASDRKDPKRIEKAMDILSSNPGIPNKTWLKEKITEVSAVLGIKPTEPSTEDQTA